MRRILNLTRIALAISLCTFVVIAFTLLPRAQEKSYDLIIKNARIVDGTGNPWFLGDVAIKDKRIARIGKIDGAEAEKVIDANNKIVAPGFIDVHAHTESIFEQPEAENFVRMGVTSLVTGNCGSSVTEVGKFLSRFDERPLTVNLGTLVAHGSVRSRVMKLENRAPTTDEMQAMESVVESAMRDGALGLSSGLIYVPGTYAKTDEVVNLARVAARHNGLYATHMRDEGAGVMDAIRESIAIGEQAKLPVEISHFKISSKRLWDKSTDTLGLVEAARARGLPVTVDQYAYTASSTSLDVLLPDWALAGGRTEGAKRLEDAATKAKIISEMKAGLKRSGFKDYSYAMVAGFQPDMSLSGKSIVDITKSKRGKTSLDAQLETIFEMYKAGGAGMVYHKMNEEDVKRIMRAPYTMIASDSGVRKFGQGSPHPRSYGNNARVLGHYVRELKIISLEDAIRKMTSLPAQTFNLKDRGLLREGYAADLVIFDADKITDNSKFDDPHHYPSGITYVLVNGTPVFENDKLTGAFPGQALKRSE